MLDSIALLQSGSVCWEWFIKAEAKKTGPSESTESEETRLTRKKDAQMLQLIVGGLERGNHTQGALRRAVSPGAGLCGGRNWTQQDHGGGEVTHHPKRANYGSRLLPSLKGLSLSDILPGLTHCPGMPLKDALGEPSASVAPFAG